MDNINLSNFQKKASITLRFFRGFFYISSFILAVSIPFRVARDYIFLKQLSPYISAQDRQTETYIILNLATPYAISLALLLITLILYISFTFIHKKFIGYKPKNTEKINKLLKGFLIAYFIVYGISVLSNITTIQKLEFEESMYRLP